MQLLWSRKKWCRLRRAAVPFWRAPAHSPRRQPLHRHFPARRVQGHTLRDLAQELGIATANVIAVGDNHNDLKCWSSPVWEWQWREPTLWSAALPTT